MIMERGYFCCSSWIHLPRQWSQAQNLFMEMTQETLQADLILNAERLVSLMGRFLKRIFWKVQNFWNNRICQNSRVSKNGSHTHGFSQNIQLRLLDLLGPVFANCRFECFSLAKCYNPFLFLSSHRFWFVGQGL